MGCFGTVCSWLGCSCRPKRNGEKGGEPIGLSKKRSCTDVPCCLLFLALWGAVGYVYYAVIAGPKPGEPLRLLRATDFTTGNLCQGETPYGYYPNLALSNNVPSFDPAITACAASCSVTMMPSNVISVYPSTSDPYTKICYPDVASAAEMLVGGDILAQMMGDLETSLAVIGAAVGASIVIAFLYAWLMKRCAGVVVWLAVIGILLGLGGVSFFFGWKGCVAPLDAMCSEEQKAAALARGQELQSQIISYSCAGLFLIFGLVICCLRKRIKIAVEVVKSASRAIGDMPMMIFFPIIPMLVSTAFTFGWVYMSMYIYTTADKAELPLPDGVVLPSAYSAETTYVDYAPDEQMQGVLWGHLFFFLWVCQFIVYFVYIAQSGAVADWYFSRREEETGKKARGKGDEQLARFPLCRSLGRVFRYHFGTVAFASFLVALIQFIRVVFEYMARKFDKKNNPVAKALVCCIRCALWCLEKIMDAISKNSLVFTAIYGDAFCPACYGSFKLVWRNLARVAAVSMVAHYVMFLGKVLVAAASTGVLVAILTLVEPYKSTVSDPLLPAALTFILSYFVGSFFMTTYATSIDTVFICFLVDEEGNEGQMFADEGLKNIVEKHAADSQRIAERYNDGAPTKTQVEPVNPGV